MRARSPASSTSTTTSRSSNRASSTCCRGSSGTWTSRSPTPRRSRTYLICPAARQRLTVILSGMGGDEVFAGYPRHLAARIGRVADAVPQSLRGRCAAELEGRFTLGRRDACAVLAAT